MATRSQQRLGIEVHRLSLRDTVNEHGDDHDAALDPASAAAASDRQERRSVRASRTSSRDLLELPPRRASVVQAPPPLRDSSRQVLLVTRPSQRDLEQWTERATTIMVRSKGGSVRAANPVQLSRRWVLEYKPVVRHSGWLIKRGHSIRNFKRRLFCIIDHELVYHDAHDSTDVRGRIDLRKRTTLQCLLQSGFSLSQGSYQMVLYAIDQNDRDVWIKHLLEQGAELLPASAKTARLIEQHSDKHPIVFSGWLRKRGQMFKSTKRRWFELSPTTLTYYSHPEGGTKKGSMDVTTASISHLDTLKTGERFSFVVRTAQRDLIVHADSQEERSLWIASLSSVAEGTSQSSFDGYADGSFSSSTTSSSVASTPSSVTVHELRRRCSCASSGSMDESTISMSSAMAMPGGHDGCCRRCMSSFISKTEDALVDVTREVQLILASPYSPEGTTTAAFLKEHSGRLVDNAQLREFMTGLAEYMVDKRLNELRVLGGRAGGSAIDCGDAEAQAEDETAAIEFTERVLAIVHEQIEERVFFPLYRAVHDNIKEQTRAESKLLRGKVEVLQSKAQSFFGIGPDSVSPSAWESACATLKEVDKLSLPYMKRNQLVAACKEIYAAYHREHPSNAPMSADDFIPVFIYVVVHARLADPVLLKEMVTFFDMTGMQGEAAYFVTCLEIAIEYIRSLLIACTVVLDATQPLGLTLTLDSESEAVVVCEMEPNGQADRSREVHVGDVLVAVNGLVVEGMEMTEVCKLLTGTEGDVELCLLAKKERRDESLDPRFLRFANPLS